MQSRVSIKCQQRFAFTRNTTLTKQQLHIATMTRLLQQAMNVNNHCVDRVMNQPNDPDSLVHSFRALHHIVNLLRDEASAMETAKAVTSEDDMSSSFGEHDKEQMAITTGSINLFLACATGRDPTCRTAHLNHHDAFYFCDRMILFQNPDIITDRDVDEAATALITSTLLLNFAILLYRYRIHQSDSNRTLLLKRSSEIYYVVIESLILAIRTLPVATTAGDIYQRGSLELLLTLALNNLGLAYSEMCMHDEYNECMVTLSDLFQNQSCIFATIRPASFAEIIEEIKLNVIYWKSFAASPAALAA